METGKTTDPQRTPMRKRHPSSLKPINYSTVLCTALDLIYGMWDNIHYRLKTFLNRLGAARQIYYQGSSPDPCNSP